MRRRKVINTQAVVLKAIQEAFPGIVVRPGCTHGYQLHTTLGDLWVSPCNEAIRTCFVDVPAQAPAGTSLNPFSGKWNFECLDTAADLARAIEAIARIVV